MTTDDGTRESVPTCARTKGTGAVVLLSATLAGFTSLAAELLWMRGMGRGVGTSQEAVAGVAGLFLAGLGLGAALGARYASNSERPARTAGLALLVAGTWTALSPLYVGLLPGGCLSLLDLLGVEGGGGALPAVLLALPLVLPTAIPLGLIFPYLVRLRVSDLKQTGRRTGGVYAWSTLGALVGVLAAAFLLPVIGEALTLRAAGGAALAAALLLLIIDRPLPHGRGPASETALGQAEGTRGVVLALGASGAAALMSQMAWFRLLGPLAGTHLWSVALLLAPLLLALALGAGLSGLIADRMRRADLLLPPILVGAGLMTLLSLPLAGMSTAGLLSSTAEPGFGRVLDLAWLFLVVVGPATLFFGAALPVAVRLRADRVGRCAGPAGRIYAWNSFGALLGSLLAGYVLLPRVGAERTLLVAALVPLIAGAVLRWRLPQGRRLLGAAVLALPLPLLLWPGLMPALVASAPSLPEVIATHKPLPRGLTLGDREDLKLYARWFAGERAHRPTDASGGVLPLFEGRAGRVALIEEPDGTVGLRRGALRESVFDPDRPSTPSLTEYALGLLPALMHTRPERALVIGHGAGWTAEAVLATDTLAVDIAELDPAVLDAARAYRGLKALPTEQDERAHLVFVDGRVLLRRAARRDVSQRYDIIVSQPSHPWTQASGHLFTVEAYEAARRALREGGILAQWLNVFDMTPDLLESALASFHAVFEHVWVFRFEGEIILLGFTAPPKVDTRRWEAALGPEAQNAGPAREAGLDGIGALWKHFALDTEGLQKVVSHDVSLFHDDLPRLELELARRRLMGAKQENAELILLRGFPPNMHAALPAATTREQWLTDAVLAWLAAERVNEADQWSRKLRWGMTADAKAAQGRAALGVGQGLRALTLLSSAVDSAPKRGDLAATWLRALALVAAEEPARLAERLRRAGAIVERFPEDGRVLLAAARLERGMENIPESNALFERAVRAEAPPAPAGAGIQLARLILSEATKPEHEQRARELLANDEATYLEVDALDLLLRLTSKSADEEQAEGFERTLQTLQRTRGLATYRRAAGHLARGEHPQAVRAIRACTAVWPSRATVFELEGLITLVALAATKDQQPPADLALEEAVVAFKYALERSHEPAALRGRLVRMLRWFGHGATLLAKANETQESLPTNPSKDGAGGPDSEGEK